MRITTRAMFTQEMAMLSNQYNIVGGLQTQMSSGKALQKGSDDPILSGHIRGLEDQVQQTATYKTNSILAKNRMDSFSSSIGAAVDQLKQAKSLLLNAANGTHSNADRTVMATQLQATVNSLLSLANTKDADGNYIYSGTFTDQQTYIQSGGLYQYQGSDQGSSIDISSAVRAAYTQSGFSVFGDILNGNGVFTVSAGPAVNTGSASTSAGTVTTQSAYVADTYTLSFVTNGLGQLGYQVMGAASGQVYPPAPASLPSAAPSFVAGSTIQFNGVSLVVSGQPNAGDQFTVAPSVKQNIFDSLTLATNSLQKPVVTATDLANLQQQLNQVTATLTQSFDHLVSMQASFGANAQLVDQVSSYNDKSSLQQTMTWSSLANADLAQVASNLVQNMTSLQAAQQTYVKIQELFDKLLRY